MSSMSSNRVYVRQYSVIIRLVSHIVYALFGSPYRITLPRMVCDMTIHWAAVG